MNSIPYKIPFCEENIKFDRLNTIFFCPSVFECKEDVISFAQTLLDLANNPKVNFPAKVQKIFDPRAETLLETYRAKNYKKLKRIEKEFNK